jgi:hypothetical protein
MNGKLELRKMRRQESASDHSGNSTIKQLKGVGQIGGADSSETVQSQAATRKNDDASTSET